MWAGVFLWGSFASPDSPTGSALQPREGVHVHAGRPQKKSLARNIAGFLRLRVLRRSKQPWTSTKILMFAAGFFLSFLSQFCLGKFRFIVPWLRSIQIKSGAGMDLVTAGLWEMNLAQSWYNVSYWYSVSLQLEGARMLFYYFFPGDRL